MTAADSASTRQVIEVYLADAEIDWEPGAGEGEYVVTLPGERKLKTVASLLVSDLSMSVSAFVVRGADENHEGFYRFLLRRNLRLPGLAYAVDQSGDVYVVGRLPLVAVTAGYLDQLMGVLLEASDNAFNELLALGFRTSMQKEWDWRISRGESTRNLEAFRHLLDHSGEGQAE